MAAEMLLVGRRDCASIEMRTAFVEHLKLVAAAVEAVAENDSIDGDGCKEETTLIMQCINPLCRKPK